MNSKLSATKQLTLGGMVTAITVLCLYATSLFPVGRIPLCFVASVVIYILSGEGAHISALISFGASAAISFLLMPDKQTVYPYILLLGHYGIFRAIVQTRINSKLIKIMLKVFYCDMFLCMGVYLLVTLQGGLAIVLPDSLPIWMLVLLVQPALILYDLLYGASIAIYQAYMRKSIISRM